MSRPELKLPVWCVLALDSNQGARANFRRHFTDDDWVLTYRKLKLGWSLWRMCVGGMRHVAIESGWSTVDVGRRDGPTGRNNMEHWHNAGLIRLIDDHAARVFMLVEHKQLSALDRLCRAYIEENAS